MKCPICNGKGYVYNALGSFNEDCGHCQGTGKVRVEGEPLTEQEYLQTCSTEQLADVFFEYRYVNATPRQKLWMSASEKCIKTDIVEWLKQPHKDTK